jgi:hypothetical protein
MDIVETIANVGAYLLTLIIEAALLYRYYFSQGNFYSIDLFFQLSIVCLMTPLIFMCLYQATNIEAGSLLKAPIDCEEATGKSVCHKCGASR